MLTASALVLGATGRIGQVLRHVWGDRTDVLWQTRRPQEACPVAVQVWATIGCWALLPFVPPDPAGGFCWPLLRRFMEPSADVWAKRQR